MLLSRLPCLTCAAETIHAGIACIHCGSTPSLPTAAPLTPKARRWFAEQKRRATSATTTRYGRDARILRAVNSGLHTATIARRFGMSKNAVLQAALRARRRLAGENVRRNPSVSSELFYTAG